ncbi:MAG: hypothetical protein AVDCRST_MAG71-2895 [uncultured Lysobacter sp.]|uniref:Glycosyltransferase n=1 Tax=uncultured Lysobacter sp. TaxID=271060 RepID=A0A6J4M9Z8_9GAMM|nr:MAG: hypothetical protein AVDCRST_MAG71-2895 [uncultured Lysobacter sp.]
MTDAGLAIFVKTPGYSPVKTRLAVECGDDYAEAWYTRAAAAVSAVARQAAERLGVHVYWAVAEPAALHERCWTGFDVLSQGEGGLGERMAKVHAELVARHGGGLLIGADTPQLSVELLAQAVHWIQAPTPRLVLGPALDGGFWLFGANVAPPLHAWTSVRYSEADTADRFIASIAPDGSWQQLPMLVDVDHRPDLRKVLEALQRLPQPTDEQRALARWMLEHEEVMR